LLKRSSDIVSFSRGLLTKIVTVSFDLVLVLVLSVYLLVYGKRIGELVRRVMPPGDGTPEDDFPLLVQRAVFGYVRGQVPFSLIMGSSAAVSLGIFGVLGIFPAGERFALFFGGFYGLMEFMVIRQTVVYLRRHLVLEPWGTLAPGAPVLALGGAACAACGVPLGPDDGFCRACGAPREQRELRTLS
jgi:hypothetical protein